MFNLQGSIAALVTPMETEGDINWECLKDLIEWHIASKNIEQKINYLKLKD